MNKRWRIKILIEVIATNTAEALLAERLGADRIELIHSFAAGGLSPDLQLSCEVANSLQIPLNVMVRPQAKSFVYSSADMLIIQREIDYLLTKSKINGIVFGSLTAEGEIDFKQLTRIIEQLAPSACELTFHRAIDACVDVVAAYRELQNYPLSRVLSSGGCPSAIEGAQYLLQMQLSHRAGGPILLAGSGITPANAVDLITATAVSEIHLGSGLRRAGVLQEDLFAALRTNLAK